MMTMMVMMIMMMMVIMMMVMIMTMTMMTLHQMEGSRVRSAVSSGMHMYPNYNPKPLP
jgi:hypothetical protein